MRISSFGSAILAFLVLGALGVATILDLVDGPGSPRQEWVAKTPDVPQRLSELPRFLAQSRYYVGKRYALKEEFATWNGLAKINLFHHSPAKDVGLGKDGFLFLMAQGTVEITQGQNRLTKDAQNHWAEALKGTQRAFDDAGIGYGLLIGPNKHSIYSDKLPSWLRPAPLDEVRTADVMAVARTAFGAEYPDPRKLLSDTLTADPDVFLYHPTDTHWTEWGAALAVHDRLQAMGIPLVAPRYEITELPHSGDLARMIGQQSRWSATGPTMPGGWKCRTPDGTPLDVITIDPLMPSRFTCGSPSGRSERLVVFHDSFGIAAIPYLAGQFQQVDFIWTDQADPRVARDLNADYVLHILVERKLINDKPEHFFKSSDPA